MPRLRRAYCQCYVYYKVLVIRFFLMFEEREYLVQVWKYGKYFVV